MLSPVVVGGAVAVGGAVVVGDSVVVGGTVGGPGTVDENLIRTQLFTSADPRYWTS